MTNKSTDQVLAALRGAAPASAPVPPPEPVTGRRRDDIRFTFDVPRQQHRFIRQFVLDADTTASAATRALWALVQDDSALSQRLRGLLDIQHEVPLEPSL